MNVVPMVAIAVHPVRLHIRPLVHCRVVKRFDGIVPTAGLRVDMSRHVQRVGDVGHQLGVALATGPRILGKRRPLKPMNDVVVDAGMIRKLDRKFPQNLRRFHAPRSPRFLVRKRKTLHQHQRHVGFGFHLVGIFDRQRTHCFNEIGILVLRFRAAEGCRAGDIHLLQLSRLPGHLAQLHRLLRRLHRS